MKSLSAHEYQLLAEQARVLSRDEFGDKVLLLRDDRVMKLFRRKRLISSALIVPYALRFARASRTLQRLGVRAPIVEGLWKVPHLRRHAVVYPLLRGESLRDILARRPQETEHLMARLASFLAVLHRKGVYFRGIHLGNVLRCEDDGELELIDISEASFRAGPLPPSVRARNFKPLVGDADDRAAMERFGLDRFADMYERESGMPPVDRARFRRRLPPEFAHKRK